jgi:hypothetical protein
VRGTVTLLVLLALACGNAHQDERLATTPATPATITVTPAVPEYEPAEEREGVVEEPSGDVPASEPAPDDARVPEVAPDAAFRQPLPPRELARDAPALRAANLSPSACLAELKQRKLPFERAGGAAAGIAAPVRVTGPIRGIRFVTPGKKSVYGKLDCRLALVLDELATVLERHGVASVRVDNAYRPKAHLPGRRTSSQHRYGLALDVTAFELADGGVLSVESDWHGEIGTEPCGADAKFFDAEPRAIALRDLVCEIARSGLFHHILTPSYNAAHRDHVHFDIKRGEKRSIVE